MKRSPFLVIAVMLCLAPSAEGAFIGDNGRIAFHRSTPGTNGQPRQIHTVAPDGSGVTQITTGSPSRDPAWSPSGTRIAFVQGNSVMTADPDGGNPETVFTWPNAVGAPDWSPDGRGFAIDLETCDAQLECRFDIYTLNADGSDLTDLTPDLIGDRNPSWSPDGTRIAFDSAPDGDQQIYTIGADGSNPVRMTSDAGRNSEPDWSPDGRRIAYVGWGHIYYLYVDGSGGGGLVSGYDPENDRAHPNSGPAWSPDGTQIAFSRKLWDCTSDVWVYRIGTSGPIQITDPPPNNCGADVTPDWQPLPGPYARPAGASPFRASLVPAYTECTTPNREHGPPLAYGSCAPPAPASPNLKVGVGDVGRSIGFVRLTVEAGVPGGADDTDVRIRFSLSNVMRTSNLSEYTGELRASMDVRLTDRSPAATTELALDFDVPCVPTEPTTDDKKSLCAVTTSLDAVTPGAAPEASRAIWALDQVKVYDGGPDEDAATTADNTLFAVQGLFVP